MTTATIKPTVEINSALQGTYSSLINAGQEANTAGINFILDLGAMLKSKKVTQDIAENTLRETAKGIGITPAVKHSHVKSVTVACQVIEKYLSEIENVKVSRVLSVSVRVLAQAKASGVKNHLANFDTFKALDEGTQSIAESTAENKGEELLDEVAKLAEGITLESLVDALGVYLKKQDIRTLTTSEVEKLHAVISGLMAIEKNSKVA